MHKFSLFDAEIMLLHGVNISSIQKFM